jgi:predicted ArsR family transcriptional regulator
MGENRTTPDMSRYTVTQAADMLGISTGAVRNRLSRGTLPKVKEGGVVYVLLPADMSRSTDRYTADTPGGVPQSAAGALTSELRDRLRYVEGQLEAERQAHAESRRLLAAALERIPPQIEAPSESRESSETADERQGRSEEPRPGAPDRQEGAGRRLWRRVFGG